MKQVCTHASSFVAGGGRLSAVRSLWCFFHLSFSAGCVLVVVLTTPRKARETGRVGVFSCNHDVPNTCALGRSFDVVSWWLLLQTKMASPRTKTLHSLRPSPPLLQPRAWSWMLCVIAVRVSKATAHGQHSQSFSDRTQHPSPHTHTHEHPPSCTHHDYHHHHHSL
jgi:hypothetical protein